jgi:ribosomal RNA-processing protein 9
MSSFFTIPGAQKKRKRPLTTETPKKRIATSKTKLKAPTKTADPTKDRVERDESISGSESDDDESLGSISNASDADDGSSESDGEEETAAERRLRLAERYLENVKEQVDLAGFDAAEIDRDLIAERLQEDVAEAKGKVYRNLASELAIDQTSHTLFRANTTSFTSVAACPPYVYTTTKDLYLHKWRIQELPQNQYPEKPKGKRRRKSKKRLAPPRRQPELVAWARGDTKRAKDKNYKKHVDQILCVAASQDGKFVVTGGADSRLIVYDAETLKPIRVFTHHRGAVTGLAFRRGTNQLYSCSKDYLIKVWSLDELAYVESLFGHANAAVDIDALAQEKCVSVGSRDRTARLWRVAEESQLVFRGGGMNKKAARLGLDPRSLAHEGSIDRVAMIDDELFVTGSDNGSLSLWSTQKKTAIFVQPLAHGVDVPITALEASAEENPGDDIIPPPQPRWITALKTIPYSDVILSGSWDGYVRIWRLSGDKRKLEPHGVLNGQEHADISGLTNGATDGFINGNAHEHEPWAIKGVINDMAVFERGDRGKDGVCVVVAVGKEHRLGRWKTTSGGKNGGVVFEVPRLEKEPAVNGVNHSDSNAAGEK